MRLLERPMIIVANKMDVDGSELYLEDFKSRLEDDVEIFPVSSFTREGLVDLIKKTYELVKTTPEFPLIDMEEIEEVATFGFEEEKDTNAFTIRREKGIFIVEGDNIERIYKKINISTDEGIMRLATILNKMGVEDALRKNGIKDGDTVRLCDFEFEYYE